MDRHICKPIEGDALNFAIKVTYDHITNGGISVSSVDAVHDELFEIDDLLTEDMLEVTEELFEPLWAIRPAHGKMYGKKYIEDYKKYLKDLFDIGERDPSKKMSPCRMLQSIERDPGFSLRLDHPSESEIRSYISSLIQSSTGVPKK